MHKNIGSYDCETLHSLLIYLMDRYAALGGNHPDPDRLPKELQSQVIDLRNKLAVLFEVFYMNPEYKGNYKMNSYSPKGTLLQLNPTYETRSIFSDSLREEYLRSLLHPERIYTIRSIIVDDPFAYVELNEHPGIRFDGLQFEAVIRNRLSAVELLEGYGPELDSDCELVCRLMEEYRNRPEPTPMEELAELKRLILTYSHVHYDIRGLAVELLPDGIGDIPRYSVGHLFDDGFRTLEITGVKKAIANPYSISNTEETWLYICQCVEKIQGELEIDTLEYDERDLRYIELADIHLDTAGLSEHELKIRELTQLNGGWL